MPKHRHDEFLAFLKTIDKEVPTRLDIHLIIDNYATYKHANVKSWLQKHPRFHLHFTPTSSSRLNLVERWFRDLTEKALRRGAFHSVPDLIEKIEDYIRANNENPKPLIWTATEAANSLESLHPNVRLTFLKRTPAIYRHNTAKYRCDSHLSGLGVIRGCRRKGRRRLGGEAPVSEGFSSSPAPPLLRSLRPKNRRRHCRHEPAPTGVAQPQ